MKSWNDKTKRLLKSELIKRGISNADLAFILNKMGIKETKASIDSKISRGSFSACFLIQCLTAIGCSKIELFEAEKPYLLASDKQFEYLKSETNEK